MILLSATKEEMGGMAMRVMSYTHRGTANEGRNVENQDRCVTVSGRDIRIIAIADGAGSCPCSGEAAEAAAKCAAGYWLRNRKFIMNAEPGDVAELTLTVVQYHLRKEAKELGRDVREQCCTLIMCMADSSTGEAVMLHIGDGSIYGCRGGALEVISGPENGRSLSETYFAVCRDALEHCRVQRLGLEGLSGLMVCTDGLDRAFSDNPGLKDELARTVFPIKAGVKHLLDKCSKKDDTTFAAVSFIEG